MPSSSFPEKGRALLLSTAAAGLALSAALAASPAFAANECGAAVGGVVSCAAGTFANGISYPAQIGATTLTTVSGVQSQGPISLSGTGGNQEVDNAGTVNSATTAAGISVNATGGNATVNNTGDITSGGDGIDTASTGGNSIITNSGTITPGSNAFAINTTGTGQTTVENTGTMNGPITLSTSDNTVTNDTGGTWNASGTSSFGAVGSNNTFNNNGALVATGGTTTFSNLTTFNNDSTVDIRNGNSLNIAPAVFNGQQNSQLLVLANGPDGVLTVGSSTGTTSVVTTDVLGTAPGQLNLNGTTLVQGASPGTFDLNGNPNNVFHKGFVDYTLQFDQNNGTYTLFGLPGREVFEALSIPYAAQTYWFNSANAWSQREMSLRDSMVGDHPERGAGWQIWMVPFGGHQKFDRDQIFTFQGSAANAPAFSFDSIGTHTSFFGLQAGADIVSKMDNGYGYWGFTGGVEQQETDFIGDNENGLYLLGGNVGMYGGINWSGLYFNALGKVDFINLNSNFNSADFSPSTSWMTWGGQGEVGYRWPVWGVYVEPSLRVGSVWTENNSLFPDGAAIRWNLDTPVVQAQAGGRIGWTMGSSKLGSFMGSFLGSTWNLYGGLWWADQWNGRNGMTFATGTTLANSTVLNLVQRNPGSYMRAEYGGETGDFFGGLHLFFKGENDFNGNGIGGWAAQMGVNFTFY